MHPSRLLGSDSHLADLKSRVTSWEQGDANSLNIAQEKLERARIVLAHAQWPPSLTGAIQKMNQANPGVATAFHHKMPGMGQPALKPFLVEP